MSVNGDADRSPVSRVLSAGAKGAERVAHATGVDRALDQAVEEAIVRALRSPAVIRAIERALESDAVTAELRSEEIARVVKRVTGIGCRCGRMEGDSRERAGADARGAGGWRS